MSSLCAWLRSSLGYPTCRCDTSGVQATAGLCVPFRPVGSYCVPHVGHRWVPSIHTDVRPSWRNLEPAHSSCWALDKQAPRDLHRRKPARVWVLSKGRLLCIIFCLCLHLLYFYLHWYSSFISCLVVLGWPVWWGPSGVDWLWGVCSGGRRNWSHPIRLHPKRPGVQVLHQVQDSV